MDEKLKHYYQQTAPAFIKKQLDEIANTMNAINPMTDKIVLVNISILMYLFRKTDKANSVLILLVIQGYTFCISAITEY